MPMAKASGRSFSGVQVPGLHLEQVKCLHTAKGEPEMADTNKEKNMGIQRNTGPPRVKLRIHENALHAPNPQTS